MTAPDITALLHARKIADELEDRLYASGKDLIERLAAAWHIVRVAGEGPARWEWVEATGG